MAVGLAAELREKFDVESELIEGSKGISVGYDQCPADQEGSSVVSIAGTLLYG